jgi:hypothetical protein
MNIILGILLFSGLLLALDLLTAPKHAETVPRAGLKLKESRRAA